MYCRNSAIFKVGDAEFPVKDRDFDYVAYDGYDLYIKTSFGGATVTVLEVPAAS